MGQLQGASSQGGSHTREGLPSLLCGAGVGLVFAQCIEPVGPLHVARGRMGLRKRGYDGSGPHFIRR